MKRLVTVLLALCLVLGLGACGETPEAPSAGETTVETAPALTETPPPPRPLGPLPQTVIVRMPLEVRTGYDSETGEIPVLTMENRIPEVFLPWNLEVQDAANTAIAGVAETCLSSDPDLGFEYRRLEADAARMELPEAFTPWYVSLRAETRRGDDRVLSLNFTTSSYQGGAHGWYANLGLVLDMQTGKPLTLWDLALDPETFGLFLTEQMVALAQADPGLREQIAWFEEPEYAQRFAELQREGSWYLDARGLVLFSELEEFGPYAAGSVEFHIPYEDLEGRMKPELLPPAASGTGTMTLDAPEGCNARILDDVADESTGQMVLLTAHGRVTDVSLSHVRFDGSDFSPMDPLWFAGEMEDCALRIDTMFPDTVPALMVSWRTEAGSTVRLLAQSGEDGSYFLMEP